MAKNAFVKYLDATAYYIKPSVVENGKNVRVVLTADRGTRSVAHVRVQTMESELWREKEQNAGGGCEIPVFASACPVYMYRANIILE
jgi:hypothetical protein